MIISLLNVLGAVITVLVLIALAFGGVVADLHERLPMVRHRCPRRAASIVGGLTGRITHAEEPVTAQ